MEIDYANSPAWATLDNTSINLTVKFSAFDFEVPFNASPQDSEFHGRQLFASASAGEFGPVAEYVQTLVMFIPPISPRQIRQALTRAGLRTAVEAAVAAGDQDLKDWYEFSTAFERDNVQVDAMGAALGVPAGALDDLWALGITL